MIKKLLIVLSLALSPLSASAASTFTYTCANFTAWLGSGSCSGSTITFTSANEQFASDKYDSNPGTVPYFNLANGGAAKTWYVSATVSGLTNRIVIQCYANAMGCGTTDLSNGVNTDVAINQLAGDSKSGLSFYNRPVAGTYGSGTITDICITDTPGSCSTTVLTPILGLVRAFWVW